MKEAFKGYYKLDENSYSRLWDKAIFVFDTNVLLNLYRYQSSTGKSLLEVMEKLGDRIWMPYHVGLEFQRNRTSVIAEQHNRFSEVKKAVEQAISTLETEFSKLQLRTRHSLINPDQIIADINAAKDKHFTKLEDLEKTSICINTEDNIRNKLEKIFDNKIGVPPADQTELNKISSEGEERYKNSIPPGFKDVSKENSETEFFSYGGLCYEKKFGDLIIWKQIIHFAKEKGLENLIFITDDSKSDWWQIVKGKTIGARPELIEEIQRQSGVNNFQIYNTEGFLKYANEHLKTKVKEDAIDEVREVHNIRTRILHDRTPSSMRITAESAERAVYTWLLPQFDYIETGNRFPDFIAYRSNEKYGFEVKIIRDERMIFHRIGELVYRAYHALREEKFVEISFVFVVLDRDLFHMEMSERLKYMMRKHEILNRRHNINVILGHAEYFDPEEGIVNGFIPFEKINLSDGY